MLEMQKWPHCPPS